MFWAVSISTNKIKKRKLSLSYLFFTTLVSTSSTGADFLWQSHFSLLGTTVYFYCWKNMSRLFSILYYLVSILGSYNIHICWHNWEKIPTMVSTWFIHIHILVQSRGNTLWWEELRLVCWSEYFHECRHISWKSFHLLFFLSNPTLQCCKDWNCVDLWTCQLQWCRYVDCEVVEQQMPSRCSLDAKVKGQVRLAHLLPVDTFKLVVHGHCEDVLPESDTACRGSTWLEHLGFIAPLNENVNIEFN